MAGINANNHQNKDMAGSVREPATSSGTGRLTAVMMKLYEKLPCTVTPPSA